MTNKAARGRPRKSSFYHTRQKIGLLNLERTAQVLGVTIDDVLQFDRDGSPIAERVLLLWDNKRINVDGWSGWTISQGCLVYKRQRWRPETLLQAKRDIERIYTLEQEIRKLKSWTGIIRTIGQLIARKKHEIVHSHINRRVNIGNW